MLIRYFQENITIFRLGMDFILKCPFFIGLKVCWYFAFVNHKTKKAFIYLPFTRNIFKLCFS